VPSAYASAVIEAPAPDVWSLVRQFDGLPSWHPVVNSVRMLGGAGPHSVGAVREQVLVGGAVVHARLAALDDDRMSLRYEMLDGPYPVRSYSSTIRVIPVTATNESFVEWWGRYDADAAREAELSEAFGKRVYEDGLSALARVFAGPTSALS
jgi:hypothetical protein